MCRRDWPTRVIDAGDTAMGGQNVAVQGFDGELTHVEFVLLVVLFFFIVMKPCVLFLPGIGARSSKVGAAVLLVLVEVLTGRFTDLVHGGTFVVTMGQEGVSGRHHQGTVVWSVGNL